jgi:hypothetical protein
MSTVATHPGFVPPHPFFDFNDAPARIERRHEKDELRNRLLDQLEAVLIYLFPNGKRQGTRFVVGNVQGDAGDSLVIELEGPKRGVWIDFATGESGDVLALWAATRGFAVPRDFGELLDDVGDWLVVPSSFIPVQVKSSAAHDTLGPHTAKWDFRSADGELLACVYRYDTPEGKQYRPWDAADAVAEGADVPALLAGAMPVARDQPRQPFEIAQWRARERFTGEPQPRRWLIEGLFPLAQATLVAAGGGVGKSFLLLALARQVAAFEGVMAYGPMRQSCSAARSPAKVWRSTSPPRMTPSRSRTA